jgi:hypothetical protein
MLSSCLAQKIHRAEVWDIACLGNYERHINAQNIRTVSFVTKTDVDNDEIKLLSKAVKTSKFDCIEQAELRPKPDYRIVVLLYNKRNEIKDTIGIDFGHDIYISGKSGLTCTNRSLISYLESLLTHSDCFIQ